MTAVDTRTGEIFEPTSDLALRDLTPSDIDAASDPGAFVVLACERAKSWLDEALTHGDIGKAVEVKAIAETLRVATVQKQLGKDSEIKAQEIVRRAERAIGVCIRMGQESGEIKTKGQTDYRPGDVGRVPTNVPDVFAHAEERTQVYDMTDGVSDTDFEAVITEAKAEGNLSRANVVRKIRVKVKGEKAPATYSGTDRSPAATAWRADRTRTLAGKGWTASQIAKELGIGEPGVKSLAAREGIELHADNMMRGQRRSVDSNRLVFEIVNTLEASVMSLDLIDWTQVTPENASGWSGSLTKSLQSLNRLNRQLKELDQP